MNSSTAAITVGSNADLANATGTASCTGTLNRGWVAQNGTTFVKANSFDYANGTIYTAASTFSGGSTLTTVSSVVVGDIYIAKLKSTSNYAVIVVTGITDASGNNDFIEFDVYK